MEVTDGVHRIDTPLGDRVNSLYLLAGVRGHVLFDTGVDGTAQDHLAPYLSQNGIDPSRIRWIVVSHCDVDHFGGLSSVRELCPSAAVVCHRNDAPLIESYAVYERERGDGFRTPWGLAESTDVLAWTRQVTRETVVDMHVVGGEYIRLDADRMLQVLHSPGHSRGHLSLFDPTSRSLIISDAVLGDSVRLADGTPAFPPTYRFVDAYMSTIRTFEAIAPELLLTAHYPTMHGHEARSFLSESRGFVERLDQAIAAELNAVGADGLTLDQLLDRLNPKVGEWPEVGTRVALAFPVVGHLERGIANGRWASFSDDGIQRARRAP